MRRTATTFTIAAFLALSVAATALAQSGSRSAPFVREEHRREPSVRREERERPDRGFDRRSGDGDARIVR